MALILNIESSTTVCSVALARDGEVIAAREINDGYTHAEHLHVFIRDILNDAGINPSALNAVAVSKGPGSYTGLRIGVSAAKGMAYALNIPLLSVGTLESMASHVSVQGGGDRYYVPMLDARRMEVYCAVYDTQTEVIKDATALILSEETLSFFPADKPLVFFGDGMPKAKALLSALPGAVFEEQVFPSARYMAGLSFRRYAAGMTENTAYFEPFYLKEFMITPPKH